MKLLNTQFFKNHWPKILSVFFFVLLASAYVSTFAIFAPGETLNPNCAPGAGGCIVSITDIQGNTSEGTNAGLNINPSTSQKNTLYGYKAGENLISDENVGIGYRALQNNNGSWNIGIGEDSLINNNGEYNIGIGVFALQNSIAFGDNNIALGPESLRYLQGGAGNIAIGGNAGEFISGGVTQNLESTNSIYLGPGTKPSADGNDNEIVMGYQTTGNGSNTTTIGNSSNLRTYLAGLNLKAGTAAAGTAPLKFTSGTNLGTTEAGAVEYDGTHLYFTATNGGSRYQLDQQAPGSLSLTTTGSSGAATLVGSVLNVPQYAGGSGLSSDANFNTVGGTNAGAGLSFGGQANTFLGYEAGKNGGGGALNNNTGIGYRSLYLNSTGISNSAIGFGSLYSNTSGNENAANGTNALYFNTTGYMNTADGVKSLLGNTTGYLNTAIGYDSGELIANGSQNTNSNNSVYVGNSTRASADGNTNEIVIGSTAIGNGSNTATIGSSSLLRTYLTGINLKAGTATAGTAPLKFTAGTLLGTTEGGSVEYDGTHLYFSPVSSGTRYQLDQQAPGSLSITTTGSSGPATLVGSVLNVPQYTAGTGLTSDGYQNTKGGTSAGLNLVAGAEANTFLGYEAGKSAGPGPTTVTDANTAIGYQSLYSLATGYQNTAIGYASLYTNSTGYGNSSTGYASLSGNTSGQYNTANGFNAAFQNTVGTYNTAIGFDSLYMNKAGSNATAIGSGAMLYSNNTTTPFLNYNVAVGYEALRGSTNAAVNTGVLNSVLGYQAMWSNTSGGSNTVMGYQSMYFNTTGSGNSAFGSTSLTLNTTGSSNSAFGNGTLDNNTTGSSNSAFGHNSMSANTSGTNNSAFGTDSLGYNTTGTNNSAFGNVALYNNTTGSGISAFGDNALSSNITGQYNSAFGTNSLTSNNTGYNNTAIGYNSGHFLANASPNASANNSLYLGYDTRALTNSVTNEIVIGASAVGHGSNTTTIGTGNVLYIGGIAGSNTVAQFTNGNGSCTINPTSGSVGCSSDITLKKNITTLDGKEFVLQTIPTSSVPQTSLEKIMEITPVNYNWNAENNNDAKHIGFIAQEMEQIFPSIVATDSKTGLKSISYASITPYLVKGIQEMNLKMGDMQDITTKDPKKITLGSLIRTFLADIGNGIEKIFVKEVDTKNLCVSDESGAKTCLSKVQLDSLIASAGGTSTGGSNSNTQQNNQPVLTIDEQLIKIKTDIEALKEADYTAESWALFVTAKDTAVALLETNDAEKTLKVQALNDAVKILIKTTENSTITTTTTPVDLSAYNEVLSRIVGVNYTRESFAIYQAIANANSMAETNTQDEINQAVSNILAAQSNLVEVVL